MNFDRPPQNEKGNESLEKLENIQEVLTLNPELAEVAEKMSRSYLIDSLKKEEKELPQDLKEYYEKHSNNKEWLDILSIYPEDLQRKVIQKRPDGTAENILELRERLNEEWAKVSENFIKKLYNSKAKALENSIENGKFNEHVLLKEDEKKIDELIAEIEPWLDKFAGLYIHKSEIFPDQKVRETFGLKEYNSEDIKLSEVRNNKEWYKKIDLFVEQYFKFFAGQTKENKLEVVMHFLDFAEYFVNRDDERYHQNWLLLKNNLDVSKVDSRKFVPLDMEGSTRISNTLWHYANQQGLRYSRILAGRYNIQTKFNNYSESKLEVSSGAKELYAKYLETIFSESKYKEIGFKGVPKDFSEENKPSFYTKDLEAAKYYSGLREGTQTISAVFNFKNPLIINAEKPAPIPIITPDGKTLGTFNDKDINEKIISAGYDGLILNRKFSTPLNGWEILSFNNESRHILGTKDDIEKFKEFSLDKK